MTQRAVIAVCAAIGLGLLSGTAAAQDQDFFDAIGPPEIADSDIGDCLPRPIAGTVPFLNAFEARKTNAQLFGTIGFFERIMLKPSPWRGVMGELTGDMPDEVENPFWAWEINVVANAVRLPSVNTGKNCGRDARYSLQGMNLYAANSALRIPLFFFDFAGEESYFGLFHAGGITANVIENSNPFFQTYKFASIGLLGTYFPPAVLAFEEDGDFQQVSGDFIAGAEASMGAYGRLYLGYAFSQGLYTNLTVDKIKFFASALLTEELGQIPLVQTGFAAAELIEGIGKFSLWGRRQELATGATISEATAFNDLRLTTGNFSYDEIPLGEFFTADLSVSYAFEPDFFLHKFNAALSMLVWGPDAKGVTLNVGLIDFPDAPYLAAEDGRRISVVLDAGMIRLGYNDPNLFDAFPYARDFFNTNIVLAF